jgi:hypothetical protein
MAKTGERWTALRKEALLISIQTGEITRDQAMRQHGISEDEMASMEEAYRLRGLAGLRVLPTTAPRACRVCGCTDDNACLDPEFGPCWWVAADLCSHCKATDEGRVRAHHIALAGLVLVIMLVILGGIVFFLEHHN